MADMPADWTAVLDDMATAFSEGDNARGEELFMLALDAGAPWDVSTAAVAQALTQRGRVVAPPASPLVAPA